MAVSIDIEKKFRGFQLRVKLVCDSGAMGILGASGSGKSMTLRCIAGIEKPDAGKIIVNGKTMFDSEKGINLKPQERRIGYLFQNYALFPTMTVEENIGCGFRGSREDRTVKVRDFLARYQLKGLEKHYPAQLSGGQQQRVALARMMIGEPEMILLDEPFSALDGYLKDVMQRDMQDFLKDYPGDMMLVTHSRDEAYKFCTHLMLMRDGRAMISGETKDIFEHPRFLEAARLTGCKNFSRAERVDEHHVYAHDWGIRLTVDEAVGQDMAYVGIRGHWMRPSDEEIENCLPVEIAEYIETTFEHQYMVRNSRMAEAQCLWWMRPKSSFYESGEEGVPPYLCLPPEHLMLLQEN